VYLIKHVKSQWDVFSGIGYDFHTRVQIVKGKDGPVVHFVYGQKLPRAAISAMLEAMSVEARYQTINV